MFNNFDKNNMPDPKQMLKYIYNNNKLIIILMGVVIIASALLGDNFFHIVYNVSLLYFGGILFKQYLGEPKLIYKLSFGALAGVITYYLMFSNEIVIQNMLLVAISAAILAVFVSVATYLPEMVIPLFGTFRVKLKYLALVLVGLEALTINFANPSARTAALGGAVFGFLSMLITKKYKFNLGLNKGHIIIGNLIPSKPKLKKKMIFNIINAKRKSRKKLIRF
jgi:membrane associated rhomboid family serine protease